MPIFHIMIFKHIFHKRESLFKLPKGKCAYLLKRKLCVASFRILTIIIVFAFMLFVSLYTLHWKHLHLQKFPFFPLKSVSNLHFPIQFLEGVDGGCLTLRPFFQPEASDVWKWPNPINILNIPLFFLYKIRSGTKQWITMNHVNN